MFGLGMGNMGGAGVSAAPSPGFWSKFGSGMKTAAPDILGALGQQYAPPWLQPVARAIGSAREAKKKAPRSTDMPTAKTPGDRQISKAPTNGIVRPPMNVNFGGVSPMFQQPNTMNMGNIGGGGNPMNMGNPRGMNLGNMGLNTGGLWSAYNRLNGLGGGDASVPPRGMFY